MIKKTLLATLALLSISACADNHSGKHGGARHHGPAPRAVAVSGSATVSMIPDQASINMSIQIRSKDLQDAQAQVGGIANRFLELTDELDIDRKNVQTVGATVRPEYRWNKGRNQQELIGHIAERRLQVELKDLDKLGALLEGAVEAGINNVSPPQLSSSNEKESYRDALALAAKDARGNAAAIAVALDAQLGNVITISSARQNMPRPMYRMEMAMAADAAPKESYNAGDISITVNTNATFELR